MVIGKRLVTRGNVKGGKEKIDRAGIGEKKGGRVAAGKKGVLYHYQA